MTEKKSFLYYRSDGGTNEIHIVRLNDNLVLASYRSPGRKPMVLTVG